MPVVPFPAPLSPAGDRARGDSVAAAIERYLDGIQTTTTRASYAETLAQLTALPGTRDPDGLQPEDYATVMSR